MSSTEPNPDGQPDPATVIDEHGRPLTVPAEPAVFDDNDHDHSQL